MKLQSRHIELVVKHVSGIISKNVLKGAVPTPENIEVLVRTMLQQLFPGSYNDGQVDQICKHIGKGLEVVLAQYKEMTKDQTKNLLLEITRQVYQAIPEANRPIVVPDSEQLLTATKQYIAENLEGMTFTDDEMSFIVGSIQLHHSESISN